jgi:hypothetical protein
MNTALDPHPRVYFVESSPGPDMDLKKQNPQTRKAGC